MGNKDGGRAVCRTDNGDGSRIFQGESQKARQAQGEKDAELGRRAKEHHLGIGQQRPEIDHGADADEQQKRKQLVGDARVKQYVNRPMLHAGGIGLVHRAGPGQVYQDRTEAHG